jgi:transcriptional antiterminator RfaH
VLHTRPRQEKSLARHLYQRGIPFYLPVIPRRRRTRRRIATSLLPLFPGYVFLWANREERLTALTTNRIAHVLEVPDQDELWHDLRQIHRLIENGGPITPEDRLGPGSLVEIRNGPLAGLRGRIVRTASGRRFVVQVNFLQRGASVLLDDFALVKADEP